MIPDLYHEFKHYGGMRIKEKAQEFECFLRPDDRPHSVKRVIPILNRKDKETAKRLDNVWQAYQKFDGIELSSMTHKDGTPWMTLGKNEQAKKIQL